MTNLQKRRKEQKTKVFHEFQKGAFTMFTVHKRTGILRATICGYVDEWKRKGLIFEVKKDFCPFTKHKAGFLTTNPELWEEKQNHEKIMNYHTHNKG